MGAIGSSSATQNTAVTGRVLSDSDVNTLRTQMGQTGYEAGDPNAPTGKQKLYVKTSKSFNINRYLVTNGADIHSSNSQWDSLGYNKRMIKNDIARIDSGMKPLTENVSLIRFIDSGSLNYMTGGIVNPGSGSNFQNFLGRLENDKQFADSFKGVMKNTDYTHPAYTSTTTIQSHPAFDNRDIKLEMVARKGTSVIVTKNIAEHEILIGRNTKYNFTGDFRVDTLKNGRKQLVLKVYT